MKFLLHYLRANEEQIAALGTGSTFKAITISNLKDLEIPLPPLATQKKIAAILDEADKVRQLNKKLIAKYEALNQSLFLDMFGDPVTNPMGWEKVKLGELNKITSGSTPSRMDESLFEGTIPWVKTGEVKGKLIVKTSECISQIALENSSCKLYPVGSIVIAMYGQGKTRGQVGMLGIPATTNQACAVLPPSELMNYSYLLELLKLSYDDLRSLGRGGNQPNLNTGLVKSYLVINPPITLQNLFAERIQAIEAQKAQAQQALEKSEALFNSLLQRAFKGELVEC
jgi:type I restriction enzyme S subunit